MSPTPLLALSGSLRKVSDNTAALEALRRLAPDDVQITLGSIDHLPLFNPDREEEHLPEVETFIDAVRQAKGLIIASPEYAHGISGPLKNALDWLVSSDAFPDKPVMLINTAPRASHAQEALKEVLRTMSGHVVETATCTIPLLGNHMDVNGILEDKAIANALTTSLHAFYHAISTAAHPERAS